MEFNIIINEFLCRIYVYYFINGNINLGSAKRSEKDVKFYGHERERELFHGSEDYIYRGFEIIQRAFKTNNTGQCGGGGLLYAEKLYSADVCMCMCVEIIAIQVAEMFLKPPSAGASCVTNIQFKLKNDNVNVAIFYHYIQELSKNVNSISQAYKI